jgi:hypothetical protein
VNVLDGGPESRRDEQLRLRRAEYRRAGVPSARGGNAVGLSELS